MLCKLQSISPGISSKMIRCSVASYRISQYRSKMLCHYASGTSSLPIIKHIQALFMSSDMNRGLWTICIISFVKKIFVRQTHVAIDSAADFRAEDADEVVARIANKCVQPVNVVFNSNFSIFEIEIR